MKRKYIKQDNEAKLVGIYALLASLFMAGVYLLIAEIEIGLQIVVFIGTLISLIVAGIVVPGIYKLYALGLVALSGTMVFITCCL